MICRYQQLFTVIKHCCHYKYSLNKPTIITMILCQIITVIHHLPSLFVDDLVLLVWKLILGITFVVDDMSDQWTGGPCWLLIFHVMTNRQLTMIWWIVCKMLSTIINKKIWLYKHRNEVYGIPFFALQFLLLVCRREPLFIKYYWPSYNRH